MLSRDICRNVYRVFPKRGDDVLEIGGHKGFFSVYCAVHGAAVRVYEPNPESHKQLYIHSQMNGVERFVRSREIAAWSKGGTIQLHLNPGNPGGSTIHRPGKPCVGACKELPTVEVKALPFYWMLQGSPEWEIAKFDCEGAEYEFIPSTPDEDLARIKYFTMEVHDFAEPQEYEELINKLARTFYLFGENKNPNNGLYYYLHGVRK